MSPLPDNRLVASYFGSIIATDASNTRFEDLTPPPPAYLAGVHEGVMMAGSHRSYGDLLASYDSGSTWRPLRAPDLARRLLADAGSS